MSNFHYFSLFLSLCLKICKITLKNSPLNIRFQIRLTPTVGVYLFIFGTIKQKPRRNLLKFLKKIATLFLLNFSTVGSVSFETWHPKVRFEYWTVFEEQAFRHADACLTLLYNTVEEYLRGMKEWHTLGLFDIRYIWLRYLKNNSKLLVYHQLSKPELTNNSTQP